MPKLALALTVAFASIACTCGCPAPAPSPSLPASPHNATPYGATPSPVTTIATDATPDDSGATIITFDDVTEKVWDVDADVETMNGTEVRKKLARRLCRSAYRTCLAPYVSRLAYQLPPSYSLNIDLQLGPKEQFKILLTWTWMQGRQPLPKPLADFQTIIYACFETEFRNGGIYKELHGNTLQFHQTVNLDFIGEE